MIVIIGNKILRQKAKLVSIKDISSPSIKRLISQMKKALVASKLGVAIAAPQLGVSLQVFLSYKDLEGRRETYPEVDKKALGKAELSLGISKTKIPEVEPRRKFLVFINPKIVKKSRKKDQLTEGCLSIPDTYGEVLRHQQVTVEALDDNGKRFKRGASGILSQVIQHEIDHLNGILFIDKAKSIQKINEES